MPADRPRRVLGYARVSSAEQALGSSLEDQQRSIATNAESRGVGVTHFFVESESGGRDKIERREQMQALLRDVRRGDLVLVDKLDRWSRDPEFTYGSVRKILEAGASFYAVSDRVDPSTHEGDTAMGFRILFAREEHKRIRERTIGTRNLLRDRGYYVEGRTPFGYVRAKPAGHRGEGKYLLVIHPEEGKLVRRMFARAAAGRTLQQIADELELDKSRVAKSLRSRHYLGELRNSRGDWMAGAHEPLVTADVFARANAAIAARRLGGPRPKEGHRGPAAETSTWLLRDLAICARCGAKMGAAYAGPKGPTRRHYYRCYRQCMSRGPQVSTGTYVPVGPAHAIASEMILRRLRELRDELARGPDPSPAPKHDFASRRAALERKRAKHIEAHAEEVITLADLRARLAKLDVERQKLDVEESAAGAATRASDPAVRRAALADVETLQRRWGRADAPTKREIAAHLATAFGLSTIADPIPNWRTLDELIADLGA